MPKQIYHYEILDEIGSYTVFEARDPGSGKTVKSIDGSPPQTCSSRVCKLDECIAEVKALGVEMFSDGRSLCLVAADDDIARTAIERLGTRGLFPESWSGLIGTPSPCPVAKAASRTPSAVVADYQRVRSCSDSREIDAFEAVYHYTRISCLNLDDLRTNPYASLRFQERARGSLLLVSQNADILALPWFLTNLLQERESLEGIFQYDDTGSTNLRLTRPAVLDRQGTYWVMRKPGIVQANAEVHPSSARVITSRSPLTVLWRHWTSGPLLSDGLRLRSWAFENRSRGKAVKSTPVHCKHWHRTSLKALLLPQMLILTRSIGTTVSNGRSRH